MNFCYTIFNPNSEILKRKQTIPLNGLEYTQKKSITCSRDLLCAIHASMYLCRCIHINSLTLALMCVLVLEVNKKDTFHSHAFPTNRFGLRERLANRIYI